MFSFKTLKVFSAINLRVRCLTERSLVVSKSTKVLKKKGLTRVPKKREPKQINKGKLSLIKAVDNLEQLWLDNLSIHNLKLFRKTSTGSFRKINAKKLFEKLKTLYPETLKAESEDPVLKITSSESSQLPNSSSTPTEKNVLPEPYVSEFFVKNMLSFPLLKSEGGDSLSLTLKKEIADSEVPESFKLPAVTRILNETMSDSSRARLNMWKCKMIAKLGVEGFNKYKEDLLNSSSKFHASLKKYLESGDESLVTIDSDIEGCWKSVKQLLPEISNVLMLEEPLSHPVLMYKGIVDCVASYRDGPCVIEWKKSEKTKTVLRDTYDAPIQLCAYLGALAWHKKTNPVIKSGLVVTAYTDGSPATVFPMDLECCEYYWNAWLHRLQNYWAKRCKTLTRNESEL